MRPIDADAFREKMYHEVFEKDSDMQKWDSGCWIRYKLFENQIDKAPTIEERKPERKPGRWISFDSDSERYDDIKCSACGKRFTVDADRYCDIGFIVGDLKYCPNCGAKMEVEHE